MWPRRWNPHLLGPWVIIGGHQHQRAIWNFCKEVQQELGFWERKKREALIFRRNDCKVILISFYSLMTKGGSGPG